MRLDLTKVPKDTTHIFVGMTFNNELGIPGADNHYELHLCDGTAVSILQWNGYCWEDYMSLTFAEYTAGFRTMQRVPVEMFDAVHPAEYHIRALRDMGFIVEVQDVY